MAKFEKGHKKVGGRRAGTPNRTTIDLFAKCDAAGIDPFGELLVLCKNAEANIKLAALKEVSSYLYPKRKALELEDKTPTDAAQTNELSKIFSAMMDELKQDNEALKLKIGKNGAK